MDFVIVFPSKYSFAFLINKTCINKRNNPTSYITVDTNSRIIDLYFYITRSIARNVGTINGNIDTIIGIVGMMNTNVDTTGENIGTTEKFIDRT